MVLQWTLKAVGGLGEAGNFIDEDNPQAAEKMAGRVREAVEYLLEQPNMGKPGRLTNTRELVISGTPFIIVYSVRGTAIQILRVLHHSRKRP
jgi:toxin ParE1/3/4